MTDRVHDLCPICGEGCKGHNASSNRVQQSPPEKANPNAETRARAMLYQAVWETSQFCDFDEIRRIVEGTLHNIAGDEP